MSRTVLVIPFIIDATNLQVFLHKEVELPQPLPDLVYLGVLPAKARVFDIPPRYVLGRFAHRSTNSDPWKPPTHGPVYDMESNTNYVIIDVGGEPNACIRFLRQRGWSDGPLPKWLLKLISKPRRDPNPYQSYGLT